MATFSSADDLKRVFGGFLGEMAASDDGVFGGTGLVVAFATSDPSARFVIDGRETPQPGKRFAYYVDDTNAPEPDVEFSASADTFDALFKGEAQVMMLAMTGRVKVRGDMGKAMTLAPALSGIVARYRSYRNA